jgi:Domain of Unknown Function (DUF1080)
MIRISTPISSCFLLAGVLLAVAPTASMAQARRHNTVSFEEGEEGWYPIFDGRSLDGWTVPSDADWKVQDGEIVVETGANNLLILTDDKFSDFELRVDFLAAPAANSGIFLRVTDKALTAGAKGYEVNIAPPGNPFPTGSIIHLEAAAAGGPPKFGATKKAVGAGESTEWRTYDITAVGGRITVKIDGQPVAELEDPEPIAEGYVGLQHNIGKVQFRNVKIRRLR